MCQSDTVNTHNIPIYVVCCICRNLRTFWGDQTNPKSAFGGPNSVLIVLSILMTITVTTWEIGIKATYVLFFRKASGVNKKSRGDSSCLKWDMSQPESSFCKLAWGSGGPSLPSAAAVASANGSAPTTKKGAVSQT